MVSTLDSSVPFSSWVRSSAKVGVPSVALSLTRLYALSRNDMVGNGWERVGCGSPGLVQGNLAVNLGVERMRFEIAMGIG